MLAVTLRCTGSELAHLYTGFGQVDGESQPLSHANIWVLRLLEGLLQSLQLRHGEGCAAAALLLLVAKPSFQNKLWQRETHNMSSPKYAVSQCITSLQCGILR